LPAAGSPLIGAVPVGDCGGPGGAITDDQRGVARPQGANCDIGSVEQVDDEAVVPPVVGPPGPVAGAPSFTG
jgi:hypothetical protein